MLWRLNRSKNRHTPTRMPYSCQLQFGTSGNKVCPVGGAKTCRAIGLPMSQTSRLTMLQKMRRLLFGSLSGGRSTIAENAVRSRGNSAPRRVFVIRRLFIGAPPATYELQNHKSVREVRAILAQPDE